MRRALIILASVLWVPGMLGVMGIQAANQLDTVATTEASQTLRLPCQVQDTQMTAQTLASYEGPFWEDGSDQEVAGIAALVVTNSGGTMISQGAVILEWGEDRLVFELEALPAGMTVLVLEKDQKTYAGQTLSRCYGWARTEYPENKGEVTVQEYGSRNLLVTNRTDRKIPLTRIRFKGYDPGSGMFIGGVCHEALVEQLRPGESRLICPYYYACGYSKVVWVGVENE